MCALDEYILSYLTLCKLPIKGVKTKQTKLLTIGKYVIILKAEVSLSSVGPGRSVEDMKMEKIPNLSIDVCGYCRYCVVT